MYLLLCFFGLACQGLVQALQFRTDADSCSPETYGREGQWVNSSTGWGYLWEDKHCGVLPELDAKVFCIEKLQCQSILFAGDSTASMFYFAVWETLNNKLGYEGRVDGKGIHPDGWYIPGVKDDDYSNDCGVPQYEGEPNQREICQQYCSDPVHMTLIRHDHLNGQRVPMHPHPTRSACDWKPELDNHPWVVLHTGTHVNDSPDEMMNVGNTWEKRADALFEFLSIIHPRGIVWRTAHPGYFDVEAGIPKRGSGTTCGDARYMRNSPLPDDEIETRVFNGSWARFPLINEVYKRKLRENIPEALLLDTAPLTSMRGDCRTDPIHFDWHNKEAPVHMWTRMLQRFMTPLNPVDSSM